MSLHLLLFIHTFLKKGIVKVDRINPRTGIRALRNGYGALIKNKNITTIIYVVNEIIVLLVLLVSQALSVSTRLFLSTIFSISLFILMDPGGVEPPSSALEADRLTVILWILKYLIFSWVLKIAI